MPRACSRSPSSGVASWLFAPPATTGAFSAAIDCSVRIAPSALGLSTSASSAEDLVGRARPCRLRASASFCALAWSTSAIVSFAPSAQACSATPVATLPAPCIAMCRPLRLSLPSARFTAALMPRKTPSEVCGPGSPPTSPAESGRPATNLVARAISIMSATLMPTSSAVT